MIDTHSHIYEKEYDADRQDVVQRALDCGVTHSVLANVDASTIESMISCHRLYPTVTSMAMGLHPTSVAADWQKQLRVVEDALSKEKYVAIGEVGLDLYWDTTFEEEQCKALAQQIDWAIQLELPIIFHIRKAYSQTFKILRQFDTHRLRGVFHCFSGGVEEARKAVSLGFYLGVGGVVTYKNSNLRDILRPISLEHIVLETDAPYLSPVPHRGKRNEPSNLTFVLQQLAAIFDTNAQNIDEITTNNATKLFDI